jgi:hypothetical protein
VRSRHTIDFLEPAVFQYVRSAKSSTKKASSRLDIELASLPLGYPLVLRVFAQGIGPDEFDFPKVLR